MLASFGVCCGGVLAAHLSDTRKWQIKRQTAPVNENPIKSGDQGHPLLDSRKAHVIRNSAIAEARYLPRSERWRYAK
jgi:hypothetical protein